MIKLDISFFLGILVGATFTIYGFYYNLRIQGRDDIVAIGFIAVGCYMFIKKKMEKKNDKKDSD